MEELKEYKKQEEVTEVILVGVDAPGMNTSISIQDSMDELKELAVAAGAEVKDSIVQKLEQINTRTYIGKGKVFEIAELVNVTGASMVIFNDDLSGVQIRNLEDILDCRVIDRTVLILDIFARRAQTKIAKLQVELAQLQYRLPRLSGMSSGLSRTGAGIGTRGPGEQKLEVDRRHIRSRMSEIQRRIREAEKVRETQRGQRIKSEIPVVALVGYTNAGKSTVLNYYIAEMEKKGTLEEVESRKVFAKDMLFATLDTYARKITFTDGKPFLLIDTVGFVSKLPHSLIEAFKATLEEVVDADLLIQVVDASNENFDLQMEVARDVLGQLGANDKQMVVAYNKIDRTKGEVVHSRKESFVHISAKHGNGMEELVRTIERNIYKDHLVVTMHIPFQNGDILGKLCDSGNLLNMEYDETGTKIRIEIKNSLYEKYKAFEVRE